MPGRALERCRCSERSYDINKFHGRGMALRLPRSLCTGSDRLTVAATAA